MAPKMRCDGFAVRHFVRNYTHNSKTNGRVRTFYYLTIALLLEIFIVLVRAICEIRLASYESKHRTQPQKSLPCRTVRHSPGNSLTRAEGDTVLGSVWFGTLVLRFLSAPVVFGFSIDRFLAISDLAGALRRSKILILQTASLSDRFSTSMQPRTALWKFLLVVLDSAKP